MNIDKAIELLNDEARSPRYKFDPDRVAAFKLGIEIMKSIRDDRAFHDIRNPELFPGETKD